MARANGMTPKQTRFVEIYLVSLNATQAAIEAGYSAKTAEWIGPQLLGKTHVAAAIAEAMKLRSERTMIGADNVLKELARIAFFDIGNALTPEGGLKPLDQMDEDTRRAIAGIEVNEIRNADGDVIGYTKKIKLADKIAALDRLGKHLGLFDTRIKVSGDAENPLVLLIRQIQGSAFNPVRLRVVDSRGDEKAV